jgi:hypothetical protein
MKNVLFAFLIWLTISFSFPQNVNAHGHSDPATVSLTASVFNDAEVASSVLSEARDRATEILRRSGITLTWLDCGFPANPIINPRCRGISFPEHLSVRLVPKFSPVKEQIFGQSFQNAAGEGSYVLVYFPAVAAFKPATAVSTGDLLGCVVAHELGHLLLGNASHSANGLMSAVWQDPELRLAAHGDLLFTSNEADRMRVRYIAASARLRKLSETQHANVGK